MTGSVHICVQPGCTLNSKVAREPREQRPPRQEAVSLPPIHKHKYKYTNTKIQKHKYTNAQIQIHKNKYR